MPTQPFPCQRASPGSSHHHHPPGPPAAPPECSPLPPTSVQPRTGTPQKPVSCVSPLLKILPWLLLVHMKAEVCKALRDIP